MNREDDRLARSVGMCQQEMRKCFQDEHEISSRHGLRHLHAAQDDDRVCVVKAEDTDSDIYPILKRRSQQHLEM